MPIADLIDKDDRAWLDWRWCWLIERIGTERACSAQVLGSVEAFVQSSVAITPEQMQALCEKIAQMLGVTGVDIHVVVGSNQTPAESDELDARCEAAKQGPRSIVLGINRDDLADPQVCAFFAMKRIILDHLFISGWLTEEDEDAWEIAEIAAVQLGVGVILANNAHVDQSVTFGTMSYRRSFRGTQLSQEMLVYALARFAHLRREMPPPWQRWLTASPRQDFKACLAELETTPPPERMARPEGVMSPAQWWLKKQEEQAEDWSDEDLVPPNPQDIDDGDTSPDIYCRKCAYIVSHLPPGNCPECGAPFDPEDLRTVTLDKSVVQDEKDDKPYSLLRRYSVWLIVCGMFLLIYLMSVIRCS